MFGSRRPISITLLSGWLIVEGMVGVTQATLVALDALLADTVELLAGVGVFAILAAATVVFALRLVLAIGLFALQPWSRPVTLAFFTFAAALNLLLFGLDVAIPMVPTELFVLTSAVNLGGVIAVLMQPGAFTSVRPSDSGDIALSHSNRQ
jgi:hypothetical protein